MQFPDDSFHDDESRHEPSLRGTNLTDDYALFMESQSHADESGDSQELHRIDEKKQRLHEELSLTIRRDDTGGSALFEGLHTSPIDSDQYDASASEQEEFLQTSYPKPSFPIREEHNREEHKSASGGSLFDALENISPIDDSKNHHADEGRAHIERRHSTDMSFDTVPIMPGSMISVNDEDGNSPDVTVDVHLEETTREVAKEEELLQHSGNHHMQNLPDYIEPAFHSGLLHNEHEGLIPLDAGKSPNMRRPKMRIGEELLARGLISKDQLGVALQEQKQTNSMLGQILVEFGFITESALTEILAEASGAERLDIKTMNLDPSVIKMIPKEVASRHKVIPVSLSYNELKLAMLDVYDVMAMDAVRRHIPRGTNITPIYSTETEIQELLNRYFDYEISIDGILREIETGIRENKSSVLDGNQEGYVNPTVRLVNALLIDAVKQGASDLHFEPEGTFLRLRYRIDGQLIQVRTFHRDYWSAIAVRIKIMGGMNIAETRLPQDGRVTFNALGREVDFRVATQPTVSGENIVMRLLDKSKSIVPLEYLGFSEHNLILLKKLLKRPEGIIIVTGPTGSGKTTTLYSILNYINSIDVNIMTLEDPVEYELPLIRQTNVKEGVIGFSSGIKSLMRQDPDIIFIGEVRDEETALNAVRAALTGHQVFSTLHTNDALGIIPRLNDIGVPSHMLAGSLICGVAQRLARKLCPHCKTPRLATPEECRILGKPPAKPPEIYDAVGCESCNNKGYKGRTALVEIMPIDEEMDEFISTDATRSQMMEYLMNKGFIPMIDDGISKVLNGEIDIKELVARVNVTSRM